MIQKDKIKICMMVTSLGIGGAERSSAILSRMLVSSGYDVTIVSVLDNIVYEYGGNLVNLGSLTSHRKGILKKFLKFRLVQRLFVNKEFDYVLDERPRQSWLKQWLTNVFIFKNSTIVFIVHSYNLRLSFPKHDLLAKNLYKSAYKLVAVSKAIVSNFEKIYGFKNGICIYNAFDEIYLNELAQVKKEDIPKNDYILSYGRIVDEIKNYSFLIRTYSKSKLPLQGIKLYIIGDGPDKIKIQELIKEYNIESAVVLMPFSENPFPYVKNALFTTLTSNYEGFPMILIESLAMGTPVVSVDCKSGPSEIIVNGKNGILVPFNKERAYIDALNKMIEDQRFYKQCVDGTLMSVSKFKIENILPQWQALLPPKR